MFFCEQGSWDKEKQAYVRPVGGEFNTVTNEWQTVFHRSPFDSIPACFWWAIVTATTVGYGDMSPTTPAGKAVAGVSMAWSLCVLALPIGVIGNNFSQVWAEYDKEKQQAFFNHQREQMMLNKSKAWGDPLHYSKRMILEVWHDPDLGGKRMSECDAGEKEADDHAVEEDEEETSEPDAKQKKQKDLCSSEEDDDDYVDQAEFMGEADFQLDLPTEETEDENAPEVGRRKSTVSSAWKRKTVALRGNPEKARRRVRGFVSFEYRWTPDKSSDALIAGKLEVKVVSGHDLIAIDWKGSCASDPYVKVIAHPRCTLVDGHLAPVVRKSKPQWDTSDPTWDFETSFDINWSKAGTEKYMANDMRRAGDADDGKKKDPHKKEDCELSEHERQEKLARIVPKLQDELAELQRRTVPEIKFQIQDVQQDLLDIVAILRKRGGFGNGAISAPAEAPQQLDHNRWQQSSPMPLASRSQSMSPVVAVAPAMVTSIGDDSP